MQIGELRKFKTERLMTWHPDAQHRLVADQSFVIIALYAPDWNPEDSTAYIDFLVGGRLEVRWGRRWVNLNSEALNETV